MATRMIARRTWSTQQAAGGDSVAFGIWLPPGSAVHNVRGTCIVESTQVSVAQRWHIGSMEGWVFNVDDLDGLGTMDTEFDIHVPKDANGLTLDLDAGTADTTPFFEPGEESWEFLFPIGRQPRRVFRRKWLSSFGHNSVIVNQDPETPFAFQFIGGLTFPVGIQKGFRVDDPSLMAFAVAAPDTLQTSVTKAVEAIAENEWGQLRYIDHVMERAMLSLLGLTEAGAETPWSEATLLLEEYLNPPVYETSGGMLEPVTWRTYGEVMIDLSVTGSMEKARLDLRR